ncbi:GGDEF domain-containing protein [Wenzhouxiangella sp. XN79A]|uniref:GGDEF domain-containing protein n=1 Tax=Wenzhouxiangella sp. XN79A TaxID=2724193 RepID=UPI00144A50DA|nr:GGDEF domain-containing protein [Wenzhouxiangella sp. XN79A]NKI36335.1 GGDEF domain-containing protein [Wenzhouxiangella sp. XN79A]
MPRSFVIARFGASGNAPLRPRWVLRCLLALATLPLSAASADEIERAEALLTGSPAAAVERAAAVEPGDAAEAIRRAIVLARGRLMLGASRQAEQALDEARERLDEVDDALRSRWYRTRATVAFSLGEQERSLAASRRALGLLDAAVPATERAEALAVAVQVALGARIYSDALSFASDLQQLISERDVEATARYDAEMMLAVLHREFGDTERASSTYRRAARTAVEIGDPMAEADARFARVQVLMNAERLDGLSDDLDDLENRYRDAGDDFGLAMVVLEQARLALQQGRFPAALADGHVARTLLERLSVPTLAQRAYHFEAEALLLMLPLWRQRRYGSELSRLALSDSLTRLPNRRAFFQRAEGAIREAGRNGIPVSLLMIDLDHFKRVNDRYGHHVGDRALEEFSDCLRNNARAGDLPARFGGEEFAVLLPSTDLEGARRVAERLLEALHRQPLRVGSDRVELRASIGVAELGPGEALDTLIKRADRALYRAKSDGRDRVAWAAADA